jgi:hypothetical protein
MFQNEESHLVMILKLKSMLTIIGQDMKLKNYLEPTQIGLKQAHDQ